MDRLTEYCQRESQLIKLYLAEMNKNAQKLGMRHSHFANSHGLSNLDNVSCVRDLSKLCTESMKNKQFRKVVATSTYSANYRIKRVKKIETEI